MIKRLRKGFIVIASIMLVFLGFSAQDEASGGVPVPPLCVDCICPGLDNTIGWFDIAVSYPPHFLSPELDCSDEISDFCFTKGLLGTIESRGAGQANIGGL